MKNYVVIQSALFKDLEMEYTALQEKIKHLQAKRRRAGSSIGLKI